MTLPFYIDDSVTLHHGDCLDVLVADLLGYDYRFGYFPPAIPDASVDAVVTDPPYGLGFMGHQWDQPGEYGALRAGPRSEPAHPRSRERGDPNSAAEAGRYDLSASANARFGKWCESWATECLRVLKPGGHIVAFGGSRTWHRLATAIEDAGFELRDSIAWLYGSGFPKSMDVSKAIDSHLTHGNSGSRARRVTEQASGGEAFQVEQSVNGVLNPRATVDRRRFVAGSPEADKWHGWGTALKPSFEPIVLGRKPLAGTVASNVLTHGTGALNIDGCRLPHQDERDLATSLAKNPGRDDKVTSDTYGTARPQQSVNTDGRWPTNVALDEDQADELDRQVGIRSRGNHPARRAGRVDEKVYVEGWRSGTDGDARSTEAGAPSRFFYVAKANTSERPRVGGVAHPTVKPLALMRWLVRLVTPPPRHRSRTLRRLRYDGRGLPPRGLPVCRHRTRGPVPPAHRPASPAPARPDRCHRGCGRRPRPVRTGG